MISHPVAVMFIASIVVLLGVAASLLGREHGEWKNVVRIVLGVGGFMAAVHVLFATNLSGWSKVGILWTLCILLTALNWIKKSAEFRSPVK
ncbi:MAG TPA: hypothetical protein V6C81_29195 [Planktothrix sp.]|jgi:hypothetical protein